MMTEPLSCLGGFCPVRDRCELHLQPTENVSERLCRKGMERPESVRAVTVEALRMPTAMPAAELPA